MIVPKLHNRITLTATAALLFVMLAIRLPVLAEPQPAYDDDIHTILENSLSVTEIDKEIVRIQSQQEQLKLTMTDTKQLLLKHEQEIASKQEEAGTVLRAYYMGERDFLLASLLSFNSLSDLFQMLDYAEFILTHDKDTLNTYVKQYRKVKDGYKQLETRQSDLTAVEKQLKTQRERVLLLEKQLEDQLAGRSDADKLRLLIKELNNYWESAGMAEVKKYFSALSKAMQQLPTWIQDNKQLLEIKGFQYTISVPEKDLNDFLRNQNAIFDNFSFQFKNNKIIAHGKRDNIEISVSGHYTIEEEPKAGIIFHVDELLFNGFSLPDTTRQDLEDEFDLGFYPNLIVSFLKADSVELKDGEMIIKLTVSL